MVDQNVSVLENHFEEIKNCLLSLKKSWSCLKEYITNYDTWLEMDFKNLSLDEIKKFTLYMEKEMKSIFEKMNKVIPSSYLENEFSVLNVLGNKVNSIKNLLPILIPLLKKHFKEKHWNRIFKNLLNGDRLIEQNYFTLRELMSGGIQQNFNKILQIHHEAISEGEIEKQMENIQKKWETIEIELVVFSEDSSRYIISNISQILFFVDSNLNEIENMHSLKRAPEVLKFNL